MRRILGTVALLSTLLCAPGALADTTRPTVVVLSPAELAIVGGTELVTVQVWDGGGLAASNAVQVRLGAGAYSAAAVSTTHPSCGTGCAIYTYALSTTGTPNGVATLSVLATDSSVPPNTTTVAVSVTVNNTGGRAAGTGAISRRTNSSQLCVDCHTIQAHSAQYTSTTYSGGGWGFGCQTCHTPHGTRNIYLVRPAVNGRSVTFQSTTPGQANFFVTGAAGGYSGICEVCHTQTQHHRNNATGDHTHHATEACTGCHPHGKGFAAAGEGTGGGTCAGCHKAIWDGMNGTVAKNSRHALGAVAGTNDAFTDSGITWGNPLDASAAAARSCVNTCHKDHVHNNVGGGLHAYNAHTDAGTSASRAVTRGTGGIIVTGTPASKDYDGTAPNGGLCLSCHRYPVEAGTAPARPAIGAAAYAASAHSYTSFSPFGAWQYTLHDGSAFDRSCTKCHADRADGGPVAGTVPFGAVHFSNNRSLLAGNTNPGATTPAGGDLGVASFLCYNCHGNGTTGTNASGKQIATQVAKSWNHPSNADAVHDSLTEFRNASWGNALGGAARHASCLDCHETHVAKGGTHATPGNLAGPPLAGSWGAQLSSNPAFWTAPDAASFTKKAIVAGTDVEATLCFKCHSSYSWGTAVPTNTFTRGTAAFATSGTVTGTLTGWSAAMVGSRIKNNANGTWYRIASVVSGTSLTVTPAPTAATGAYTIQRWITDTAMEFNPANAGSWATAGTANQWNNLETAGGFHPVVASAGGNLGAVTLANLVTTSFPWSTTSRNVMTCSDCHESDTTTDPNGPHGSTASYILRGPNTTWNNSIVPISTGMPAGTFCANCHSSSFASSRFTGTQHYSRGEHRIACMNCHAAIPHGGPRPGMLVAPAGADANVGGSITTWDTAQPYSNPGSGSRLYIKSYPSTSATVWGESNCGCNGTSHG